MKSAEPLDITACPHWGKGGQYVIDPATGIRTRVDDAADAIAEVITEATAEATTEMQLEAAPVAQLNKKEKNRG